MLKPVFTLTYRALSSIHFFNGAAAGSRGNDCATEGGMVLRAKVGEIYNLRDLNLKGQSFNTTLLFSILNCLVPGKLLMLGGPGMGKTTASENNEGNRRPYSSICPCSL